MSLTDEIEIVLRRMTAGRDYRRWSENTINKILPFVERIIEDDLRNQEEEEGGVIGTLVIDEDIIITAMMMALCDEE